MKLSNILVIFISSSSTCSQFTYILLFQKKIEKLSEIISFLAQRDQERKESRLIFAEEFFGTENAPRGRNVCPTLEQSPGVHEEGQETSI